MKPGEIEVTELRIQRDAIVALGGAQVVRVECREGSLWITIDHDPRDVVLGPGEGFDYDGPRRVLVLALAASSLKIFSSSAKLAAASANRTAVPGRVFPWRRPLKRPRIALV